MRPTITDGVYEAAHPNVCLRWEDPAPDNTTLMARYMGVLRESMEVALPPATIEASQHPHAPMFLPVVRVSNVRPGDEPTIEMCLRYAADHLDSFVAIWQAMSRRNDQPNV